MLQAMRNGMNSWFTRLLISSLFILALGGLVLSDAGGFFRGGVSKGYVADIGGQELSFAEFDRSYRNALARLEIPQLAEVPEYREIVARETLKREIETRVLGYTARESGLIIGDQIAAKRLREYLKPLTEQGMLESSALQQVLQNQRISENVLVNDIKNDFAIELLMTSLTAPVRASDQLLLDMGQYNNEKRSASYIKISNQDFNIKTPDEEELKEFYKSEKTMWMTPEYREVSILKLTPDIVLEKTFGKNAVTKDDVKALYNDRIEEFSEPDIRTVSQVSFSDEGSAKEMKEFLRSNKGMSLKQAIKNKADFEGIFLEAEEYKAGNILPKELSKPVFDLKEDTGIVGPVKSPLGWHLAFVEKTVKGKVQPFEAVKSSLREEIVNDKTADPMFEMVNDIEDMFAGGDSVEVAAEFLQLPIIKTGVIDVSGKDISGKDLSFDDSAMAAIRYAFAVKKDSDISAEMKELNDGSFIAFNVDNIIIPKKIEFSLVKSDVADAWKKKQQQKHVVERVHNIVSAVKTGKSELKDHAIGKKTKLEKMVLQTRSDKFKGSKKRAVPANFVSEVFNMKQNKDIIHIPVSDGTFIVQLDEIKMGDVPKLKNLKKNKESTDSKKSEYDELFARNKMKIEKDMREDVIKQFVNARTAKYGVDINDYSFSKQYGANTSLNEE